MRFLSLVMPYYDNPWQLARQYLRWSAYRLENKARLEIVLVDDGSPRWPALDVPRPPGLPPLRLYRVLVDKPWHQHGARNLGADQARGPWLLLTDMDHELPEASLEALLARSNRGVIYTFGRLDAPHLKPTRRPDGSLKPHPNSFAMTKALFWQIGGYDETFCGIYGTDGMFRKRAFALAAEEHLADAPLIRVPRELVADASTTTLKRKDGRELRAREIRRAEKEARGEADRIVTLNFPWERVL
jgi:hypothetical protein